MRSGNKRTGININPRASMRITRKVLIATFLLSIAIGAIMVINSLFHKEAKAAVAGDYRTVANGMWTTANIWQLFDGTNWVAASVAPTSANGTITIRTGNTVGTQTSFTVDQIVIETGAVLNVNGGNLTISNGAGNDITVDGTLNISGNISMAANSTVQNNNLVNCNTGGTFTFNTGAKMNVAQPAVFVKNGGTVTSTTGIWTINGTYRVNDQSAIPLATWSAGSTCEISGVTSTLPANISQTFYNLKWNCPNQTGPINFGAALQTVNGDLTFSSTGTSYVQLDFQGNNTTLNIGGNFYMAGGILFGCTNGSTSINVTKDYVQTGGVFAFNRSGGTAYGNISTTMTVRGNALLSGGKMDMTQCNANNAAKGNGILNLKKNMNLSGSASLTETSSASRGQVNFGGPAIQYYTSTDANIITRFVDFTVMMGSILRMDKEIISGAGNFTLQNGAGLMMGHPNGIAKTSATGNIQVTGTRTFNTGSDYTYNGTSPQNSGDGLPTQVRNLTFNNNYNITLTKSCSVSSILNFTAGICIASNDTLTLGINTSTTGTLNRTTGHVVGYFKRWVASTLTTNTLFPVGTLTNYNPAYFSFTSAPNAGSIVCRFVRQNPGTLGLPLMDAGLLCYTIGYSYWSFGGMNGFANGLYTVKLDANGFPAVGNYALLHLLRRQGSNLPWATNGIHSPGTGSNSTAEANRIKMNLLGDYGISSNDENPLPVELINFNATPNSEYVDLNWSTASETNNDYFTVERSADGINFSKLLTKKGFGNSTQQHNYNATDLAPLQGTSYYRLRQTDFDGNFTLSNIVSAYFNKNVSNDNALKIISVSKFATGFKLKYNSRSNTTVKILLLNTEGKCVYETTDRSVENINEFEYSDEKNLPAGVYFIQVVSEGQKCLQKIVKEF
jgi:hypothetical protein